MAPAEGLPPTTRQALFDDAVRLTSEAKYLCAGTVEFLVDQEGRHYFIEVRCMRMVVREGGWRGVCCVCVWADPKCSSANQNQNDNGR